MDAKDFILRLQNLCPEVAKPVWLPKIKKPSSEGGAAATSSSSSSSPDTSTKFGGSNPWRRPRGDPWPKCGECGKKKTFFCQVNLADLPQEFRDGVGVQSGLFRCFLCQDCLPYDGVTEGLDVVPASELLLKKKDEEDDEPTAAKVAKTDQAADDKEGEEEEDEDEDEDPAAAFAEVLVEDWRKMKMSEFPNFEELGNNQELCRKIGIGSGQLYDLEFDDFRDRDKAEFKAEETAGEKKPEAAAKEEETISICPPRNGIKIGGYIDFVQGVEYPDCPDCHKEMTLTFLQMEQDPNLLDFLWGDCGVAHVTLCPDCKRPALGWACT